MNELTNDEQDLMKRVATGDQRALALVMQALMGRVQALCRALLGDGADARDASQASLVEIMRAAPTFRGDCSLGYWASRITARTSLRWVRRERSLQARPPEDLAEPTVPEGGPSKVLLNECLTTLPPAQRTTLLLRCGLGYSVDEIAELTSVSPNTVKDRLLRGREALRKLMELQGSTPHVNSGNGT